MFPVPIVISSTTALGAGPKAQISMTGMIFLSLSWSLHIYLLKCHLTKRWGALALVLIISRGFAVFIEFRQTGGKRGVGEYQEKLQFELWAPDVKSTVLVLVFPCCYVLLWLLLFCICLLGLRTKLGNLGKYPYFHPCELAEGRVFRLFCTCIKHSCPYLLEVHSVDLKNMNRCC